MDFGKAFITVNREKLMIILKRHGITWKQNKLIKELNKNSTLSVRIKNELSEEIEIR